MRKLETLIEIPKNLTQEVKSLVYRSYSEINQFENDLFFTDKEVAEHVDSTKEGHLTTLVTLVNDAEAVFIQKGVETYLEPGSIIKFNARIPHSLIYRKPLKRWSAIIWDLPTEQIADDKELFESFSARVQELNKRFRTLLKMKYTYYSFYLNQKVLNYRDEHKTVSTFDIYALENIKRRGSEILRLKIPHLKEVKTIAEYLRLIETGRAVKYKDITIDMQVMLGWIRLY